MEDAEEAEPELPPPADPPPEPPEPEPGPEGRFTAAEPPPRLPVGALAAIALDETLGLAKKAFDAGEASEMDSQLPTDSVVIDTLAQLICAARRAELACRDSARRVWLGAGEDEISGMTDVVTAIEASGAVWPVPSL